MYTFLWLSWILLLSLLVLLLFNIPSVFLSHPLTHSVPLTPSLTDTHTHTQTLSQTHTLTLSLSHTHTHTHTHSHLLIGCPQRTCHSIFRTSLTSIPR